MSFSHVRPLRWPMLLSSINTPAVRSRWRHRIAQSSARRNPVTMVSQIRMAQSWSCQASLRMRAACSAVGGCGFGLGCGGGTAWAMGLVAIQRHRTARFSAPLRMKWMYVPDAPVRQRLALVRLAAVVALVRAVGSVVDALPLAAVVPAAPERGVERVKQIAVECPYLHRADQWPDVFLGQAAVIRGSVYL
ncbi:MAG: hypothetical protein QOJ06_2842 [Pseudonocardiales bacterium]|nr:hypothetical protein [Pseudonocardiales bacterium]